MKYKVGDRVKVRGDLIVGNRYGGETFTREMDSMRGRCVTIVDVDGNDYEIYEHSFAWTWTNEMFSGYATDADSVDWKRAEDEKIAVICPTEREYIELMKDCESRGYRWTSGATPLSKFNAPRTLVYLNENKTLTWSVAKYLKSENPNIPAYTYRLAESEKVTAPPAPTRPSWRLEIWSDGDKTHAEMQDERGNTVTHETVIRLHTDEYSRKAAIEALTAKLFRPEPKFKAGDVVRYGDFYYCVKGDAIWSDDEWEYLTHVSRGDEDRTWIPESNLTLVCRAEDVAK